MRDIILKGVRSVKEISTPVIKKDHEVKMSGKAIYIADLKLEGMLYATMVRSTISYGKIIKINLPDLPEGYETVSAEDVPGVNLLKVITSEQPIFAEDIVRFKGEPILMIVGPDKEETKKLASKVQIIYEACEPVLMLEEATEPAAQYHYKKGDPEEAFKAAKTVIEETFKTGYQEQAYIEPQGAVAIYDFEKDKVTVYGSMQCPYYVHAAVMQTMGLDEAHVQIIQTTTGGGFGGKEDYPSLLGCQVAVAAKKVARPVQLVLNRREDMSVTPKRHPGILTYKAGLNEKGELTCIKANIKLDAGAYAGLSSVVLQRSLIAATGVYRIEHIEVEGAALLTNTVPNGAYRGFGAPQSFFAIETLMNHIALKLGQTPIEFKKQYLVKQYDETATSGQFHHHVPLNEMLEKVEEISHYSEKYKAYQNQKAGRYQKGIGLSIFLHGCGFTGSAEKDFIKSVVKLVRREDGKVEILVSNTDIGQGLKTTFSKIAAKVLDISMEDVLIENPDTDRVPNSGPTVASRSLLIVGKLIERAAKKMKARWSEKSFTIEEHYQHVDMIPWDMATFSGDAYPTYSYGINVVEVEVDKLLATTKLLGVWGVFDVGKSIDDTIMQGQAEGGMLQGIGYGSIEKMENSSGDIKQNSFTDYMIPTAKDTVPFEVVFVENLYEHGPFGAKGAGELTLIGTAPAYEAAVEEAIKKPIYCLPVTTEKLMEVMG